MSIIFTSTEIQNSNKNKTAIILGKCEKKLKDFYNIPDESSLYIMRIDINQKSLNIPRIEYEIYFPLNEENKLEKLNLSVCKGTEIELFIPVNISNDEIDKYNPNSDYYTNKCSKVTSQNGTDISLNDRKEEFIYNNMTLCEDNCKFIEHDKVNKIAKCSCEPKTFLSFVNDINIDKDKLMSNFKDIKNVLNIEIVKCYKEVFTKENIKKNNGFFIIISIILIDFISCILFIFKFYGLLRKEIDKMYLARKNKIIKKEKDRNKNQRKNTDKRNHNTKKMELKKNKKNLLNKTKSNKKNNNQIIISNDREGSDYKINNINNTNNLTKKKRSDKKNEIKEIKGNKNKKKKNNELKQNKKKKIEYNDYELNSMSYKEALEKDKRNYIKYYFSLLKKNQLIMFSFFPNKDYNSEIIKVFLFFFFFATDFTINALFFTDNTMHKIYIDEGSFNLNYQIPIIIYTSLISAVIYSFTKFLALSEKQILSIKQIKTINNIDIKVKDLLKNLKIKFSLFYSTSFILLFLFCFYISCFCGIYENTQIHLIKDSILSFGLTLITPFFTCFIPGIFRLFALKAKNKNKEIVYKISQILQMI